MKDEPGGASPIGAAFDDEAADYLTRFCEHPSAAVMRARTHAVFRSYLQPGSRLLDLCCGPGPDFPLWRALGLHFTGYDGSPGMLAAAEAGAGGAPLICGDVGDLHRLTGPFDAVSANFGGLNTDIDRARLAENLAELIPPGGYFFACIMTPFPLPELLEGLLRGRHLFRRLRHGGTAMLRVGTTLVRTHYPRPGVFFAPLAPYFHMERVVGLGIVLPPCYLPWSGRGRRAAAFLDRLLGAVPPTNRLGDHTLLVMRRRDPAS